MKKAMLEFALRYALAYVLGNSDKVKHAVALAEASRVSGDKPFVRRGRVYRSIKEWSGESTPLFLVNLGTEAAQSLDELSLGK